jgi:hypothetical protein
MDTSMIPFNLLSLALRAGRTVSRILDLCSFPALMDSFWQAIKLNTRRLTPLEVQEARRVFGNSIDYSQVLIDESSFIAWLGAKINLCTDMGVTTFYTINFNREINALAGNSDMKWLIHELTHVSQMKYVGSRYLLESFYAQILSGYEYRLDAKKHLCDYNREQQASIVADYYAACCPGSSTTAYDSYITELRAGEL